MPMVMVGSSVSISFRVRVRVRMACVSLRSVRIMVPSEKRRGRMLRGNGCYTTYMAASVMDCWANYCWWLLIPLRCSFSSSASLLFINNVAVVATCVVMPWAWVSRLTCWRRLHINSSLGYIVTSSRSCFTKFTVPPITVGHELLSFLFLQVMSY